MNKTPEKMVKGKKHYLQELKELLQEGNMPKEKVFAVFCQRHGISMNQCEEYYSELVLDKARKKQIKQE